MNADTKPVDTPASTQQPTTLFLSWSGLLRLLQGGFVTLDQLHDAVFYLGCSRANVFPPDNHDPLKYVARDDEDYAVLEVLHKQLQSALLAAEPDGRITWRSEDGHTSYRQLNELLAGRGLPPIEPDEVWTPDDEVNLPLTLQCIREKQLPYQAFTHPCDLRS